MLVRWNERPIPMRQIRYGGAPVMSRPSSRTVPLSGCRWPVIRLKSVDFPAPLGPITAAICLVWTVRLTSKTARNPPNDLEIPETSSIAQPLQVPPHQIEAADDATREAEQQHEQDGAEHERPVLRVVGDHLVEPDQGRGANRRSPEIAYAPEDCHDDDLRRFRPEDIIGEHTAAEDAVERAGQPCKPTSNDKSSELIEPHIDADKGGTLRIVPDRCQHPAERRANEAVYDRQRHRYQQQRQEVESGTGGQIAKAGDRRHPVKIRIGDFRQALIAARNIIPLIGDSPHNLRK